MILIARKHEKETYLNNNNKHYAAYTWMKVREIGGTLIINSSHFLPYLLTLKIIEIISFNVK